MTAPKHHVSVTTHGPHYYLDRAEMDRPMEGEE